MVFPYFLCILSTKIDPCWTSLLDAEAGPGLTTLGRNQSETPSWSLPRAAPRVSEGTQGSVRARAFGCPKEKCSSLLKAAAWTRCALSAEQGPGQWAAPGPSCVLELSSAELLHIYSTDCRAAKTSFFFKINLEPQSKPPWFLSLANICWMADHVRRSLEPICCQRAESLHSANAASADRVLHDVFLLCAEQDCPAQCASQTRLTPYWLR